MDEIKWEEPPKRQGGTYGKNAQIAEQLRERPETWALVASYAHSGSAASIAHQVRRGTLNAYRPRGSFEAVTRTVDGEHRVYARYVGEGTDE